MLCLVAVLGLVGCAQVTGNVHGERVVDLNPDTSSPAVCGAEVIPNSEKAMVKSLEKIGELTVEGGVWMVREDMEEIALNKACEAGAELVFLSHERYGVIGLGSSAKVTLLKRPQQAMR
jgi:hypothetical protein